MNKPKPSGPAIFMYGTMVVTFLLAVVCFVLYYAHIYSQGFILWTGIVSFMILYHFGLRILFGEFTNLIKFNYNHAFFKQKKFEAKLYKLLKVRKWKDKVLTFNPENYDFQNRTLPQLATTMAKSETDHWINEIISVVSIFFSLLWGMFPIFLITAVAAMVFDAQFIVVQRYNRPIVLRLMARTKRKTVLSSGGKNE